MELGELEAAIDGLDSAEPSGDDLRRLRAAIHRLERVFSCAAAAFAREGGHQVESPCTPAGWISRNCHMSSSSAADRLCVGRELELLPLVTGALEAGEIGFQSASLLCHLRDQLGEKRDRFDEEQMVGYA